MTKLEENIEKYSKWGMIPAVTKGKKRWRLTDKEGNQEILFTSLSLRCRLSKGDIVKVEKNRKILCGRDKIKVQICRRMERGN